MHIIAFFIYILSDSSSTVNIILSVEKILSVATLILSAANFVLFLICVCNKDEHNVDSNLSAKEDLLFCTFLGIFGVHRFYEGKIKTGILYACTLGLFGVGVIVDYCYILAGHAKEKNGNPIVRWNSKQAV